MDAAFIKECADPTLNAAIVEQFVAAAGSADPWTVTVQLGDRLVLVPTPQDHDEAMTIIRQYVGKAVVRVGLTQLPAGSGVKRPSDLQDELIEPCQNLRLGTQMFARVLRIVSQWYGNPKGADVFPQIFDDAVNAWHSGWFEGRDVFKAEDPAPSVVDMPFTPELEDINRQHTTAAALAEKAQVSPPDKLKDAEIRVDLYRINGK